MASPKRAIPEGSDGELEEAKGPKKSRKSESSSDRVVVDMSTLRLLLQEQSEGLLAARDKQLDRAVKDVEAKQEAMFRTLHGRMDHTADKVDKVEAKVEELEKRLAKMEQGGSTTAGSDTAKPGRQTLVFGGWRTRTRRQVIVKDLDRALSQANVKSQLDDDPFTMGARRTVSLCNFYMRTGENEALLKRRMFSVIHAFNASTCLTETGKKIWVSFSKTREERMRGAHAAWTKRIL